MKTAIEKLKELREQDSSIVAIAKDSNGEVFPYKTYIPEIYPDYWQSEIGSDDELFDVEFDSDDWQSCIVTYKDLENFDIETITISKLEYDRLLACESKLNEIMKILEK